MGNTNIKFKEFIKNLNIRSNCCVKIEEHNEKTIIEHIHHKTNKHNKKLPINKKNDIKD